jgi:UDP-GlcNAc:undecaprenyl-phosphate GlcNAc-1-phosphate transferase
MTSIASSFLTAAAVSAILTPLLIRWARRRGFYDAPGTRKIHARPVPRLGGIAIAIAFFVPVSVLLMLDAGASTVLRRAGDHVMGMYIGGALILALGLYDDLKGTGAPQKLAVQLLIALLMYAMGYQIEAISNPFGGGSISLGILACPITVLWFIGVINAVNLIDGLDGLAAGLAFIAVTTLFAIAIMDGKDLAAIFCASLGGALLGFLFFNFNPARIFMGDTGSLFLGFILACFSITTSSKGPTTVALVVPALALGLPIMDTMLAMGRRIQAGRSPFSSDREHIHHKLLHAGLSHRQAVLILYGVAGVLGASALMVRASNNLMSALVMLSLAICLFVFMRLLTAQQMGKVQEVVRQIEPPIPRPRLRALLGALRRAEDTEAMSQGLTALAEATGAMTVAVEDVSNERTTWYFHWSDPQAERLSDKDVKGCRITLDREDATLACLFISYMVGDGDSDLRIVLPWEMAGHILTERWDDMSWSARATAKIRGEDTSL